ncbi:hypothetical protein [Companilactobacillus nantensis]|jgi:hypothetical protein|uniref:Uncharacterized protein n=1 Tax=Companilactobacillus nantensis DSM 16982 TaxID=1423774 RepID=A0A0R1WHQ9_9LACO|nr:hypothetical protein [Companilactobacillus nantensis]KRM17490.1 hypothetical protein FD31_GL002683 [Companilactobacillus nantensis DSM 16982]GEO64465.1 hypothetical protein LNA01_16480 [Companilactobacillus nantensis]
MAIESYSKESLVNSTGFSPMDRDILKIVLDNSKQYSLPAANQEIIKFKGGIK